MHGMDLHVADEIAAVARELGVEPGGTVFTTLASSGADTREWTFVRKDGSHVRVAHTVTVHRDEHGNVIGSVGVAHDITARHLSEQALRGSEERFRALSEHAPVGIVQTDEHANCWYANRRFCELVGRGEADVHGAGWLEVLHQRRPRRPARPLVADPRGGPWTRRRVPRRPAGRHHRALRATAGPIRADDGRVSGFVITTQDVSERVGAQRRLSESQELFRNTLENVALAAIQLDEHGRVVYCNPHLAAMLGRPAANIVGCDWFSEFVPADRASTRDDFLRSMRGDLELPHNENQIVTAWRRPARDQLVDHHPPRCRWRGRRRDLAGRGRDRAPPDRAAGVPPRLPRRPHRAPEPDVVRRPAGDDARRRGARRSPDRGALLRHRRLQAGERLARACRRRRAAASRRGPAAGRHPLRRHDRPPVGRRVPGADPRRARRPTAASTSSPRPSRPGSSTRSPRRSSSTGTRW